jgi:hypothetical protein
MAYMGPSDVARCATSLCFAAAVLVSCDGPQMQPGLSVLGQRAAPAVQAGGRSWMLAEANSRDLIYVANINSGVTVYTYPRGELIGNLQGFKRPNGLCVDRKGNIFVANFGGGTIVEYAHGGKSPIETLRDDGTPNGCAIDPTTGDLAVTNWCDGPVGSCYSSGTVLIYKKARGAPKAFTDSFTTQMDYCTYDKAGNLFVDGSDGFYSTGFAELPKGSRTFEKLALALPKGAEKYPGGLQWNDGLLAFTASDDNAIYEYKIDGAQGTRVHITQLKGVEKGYGTNQFWVFGGMAVVPVLSTPKHADGVVAVFKYPAGGQPIKIITKSLDFPWAAAVSRAHI